MGQPIRSRWWVRAVVGFALGCVWWVVVFLAWCAVAAVSFGGLEQALKAMEQRTSRDWVPLAFGGYFVSAIGAWMGGIVGPLVVGAAPRRSRRPLLDSSALGAALGAVPGAAIGCLIGWAIDPIDNSPTWEYSIFGAGLTLGVLGGVIGGRLVAGR